MKQRQIFTVFYPLTKCELTNKKIMYFVLLHLFKLSKYLDNKNRYWVMIINNYTVCMSKLNINYIV